MSQKQAVRGLKVCGVFAVVGAATILSPFYGIIHLLLKQWWDSIDEETK